MQVCTSPQTDNHASTHHSVFTGQMPFLPPNQQRQNTEGSAHYSIEIFQNQNFPKPTNHIPGLSRTTFIFKDFQILEFATVKFKYFQALSRTPGVSCILI